MPEEVLFSDERHLNRSDVATYLHNVADRLEEGDSLTLETGTQEITLDVPGDVEFEIKVEREGPTDGSGEIGLELELEWPEDATDDSLSIR